MRVDYAVYDMAGRILRTGKCSAAALEAQASGPGAWGVIAGAADDRRDCVWQGRIMTQDAARAAGWPG